MNNHRVSGVTVIKIFSIVVIASITILVVSCAAFLYNIKKTYSDPYDQFLEMQARALPYLDKLNEQTLQELPPIPDGFSLLEKKSYGIENNPYYIGRWMTISFNGPQLDENPDRFYGYYKANLVDIGWELQRVSQHENRPYYYYRKGKSCLELSASQNKPLSPKYFITIWQDFEHQPFVGNIPNDSVLGFHLIDSWKIAKCP